MVLYEGKPNVNIPTWYFPLRGGTKPNTYTLFVQVLISDESEVKMSVVPKVGAYQDSK